MVLSTEDQGRLIGSPHPIVWTIKSKESRRAVATTIGARKSFENPNVQIASIFMATEKTLTVKSTFLLSEKNFCK